MKLTKNTWFLIIAVVVGIGLLVFTRYNAFMYSDTVAQVQSVKQLSRYRAEDNHDNVDHNTTQSVKLKLLNGTAKGKTIVIHNTYTDAHAVDQEFRRGQQVLLSLNAKHPTQSVISGLKRDTFMLLLVELTVILILIIVHRRGLMSVLSLIVNIILFILAIQLELLHNGKNILPIFCILIFIFSITTIGLIFGLHQEMFVSTIATIVSTFASFGLFMLALIWTHEQGMHYEAVSYAVQSPRTIYLAQVMIGVLGAIMDETTDITSAMYQLKVENPELGFWPVFKSGLNMGRQIIGPLINILFLIFMADTIPMAVLYLRNGNSIAETFNWTMYLGLVQSLVSAIGIVLAAPLTSALCGRFLKGSDQNGRA